MIVVNAILFISHKFNVSARYDLKIKINNTLLFPKVKMRKW